MHVLLDRKGKTLSHAFAEMFDEDAAKAALRTSQNSVLGKGKRARGVTVTRSSQEELMRAVSANLARFMPKVYNTDFVNLAVPFLARQLRRVASVAFRSGQ